MCATDVGDFEAALAAASRTGAEEMAAPTRAVALYRGELLPEIYDDWASGERERLAQAYLGALHRLTGLTMRAISIAPWTMPTALSPWTPCAKSRMVSDAPYGDRPARRRAAAVSDADTAPAHGDECRAQPQTRDCAHW